MANPLGKEILQKLKKIFQVTNAVKGGNGTQSDLWPVSAILDVVISNADRDDNKDRGKGKGKGKGGRKSR